MSSQQLAPVLGMVDSRSLIDNEEEDSTMSHRRDGSGVKIIDVSEQSNDDDRTGSPGYVFIAVYFVAVATVLGSGILGLPVELSDSGFSPFMLPLSLCCVIQIIVTFLMTEILQSAQALQSANESTRNDDSSVNTASSEASYHNLSDPTVYKPPPHQKRRHQGPDLHMIAGFYLSPISLIIFEFMVLVNFVSIMVGYALAGSEAWGTITDVDYKYIIPVFVLVYTCIVILFNRWLPPLLSVLTFGNTALLILMISVTAYIGTLSGTSGISSWQYVGQPFLLSTVALGGIPNTLPVVFARIKPVPRDIKRFKIAVSVGLLTCLLLNALWCYFVLQVVPQHGKGENTLAYAHSHGLISTVPLTNIIDTVYPQYKWMSIIVQGFILLAVTVSFLTMGAGFAHLLDGYSVQITKSKFARRAYALRQYQFTSRLISSELTWRVGMYIVGFGMIAVVAFTNPQGFLVVLSKVTSMAVNLESGLFIGIMFLAARNRRATEGTAIASELGSIAVTAAYGIIAYFGFAVLYDIVTIIVSLAAPDAAINSYI